MPRRLRRTRGSGRGPSAVGPPRLTPARPRALSTGPGAAGPQRQACPTQVGFFRVPGKPSRQSCAWQAWRHRFREKAAPSHAYFPPLPQPLALAHRAPGAAPRANATRLPLLAAPSCPPISPSNTAFRAAVAARSFVPTPFWTRERFHFSPGPPRGAEGLGKNASFAWTPGTPPPSERARAWASAPSLALQVQAPHAARSRSRDAELGALGGTRGELGGGDADGGVDAGAEPLRVACASLACLGRGWREQLQRPRPARATEGEDAGRRDCLQACSPTATTPCRWRRQRRRPPCNSNSSSRRPTWRRGSAPPWRRSTTTTTKLSPFPAGTCKRWHLRRRLSLRLTTHSWPNNSTGCTAKRTVFPWPRPWPRDRTLSR